MIRGARAAAQARQPSRKPPPKALAWVGRAKLERVGAGLARGGAARWLLVGGAALALLGSCRDPVLAQLDAVREEICRCKDLACSVAALDKVPKADAKNAARAREIAGKIQRCAVELEQRLAEEPAGDDDGAPAVEDDGAAAVEDDGAAPRR
ncbi:MAG: hypothetical protein R3B48_02885 [Kofleriaceae bacterium]